MIKNNINRLDKVNSLLLQELNTLLQKENFGAENSAKNDTILSITKVNASKDLRYAKVFFAVMPLKFCGTAKSFLESKSFGWQKIIGKKIALKNTPKLQFVFDKGQQNVFAVEKILSKLKNRLTSHV